MKELFHKILVVQCLDAHFDVPCSVCLILIGTLFALFFCFRHTSGTQTVYSPHAQSTAGQTGAGTTTTHTLTTVVDEGSEKKHVYYVSVIPNKGIMAKTKTSMVCFALSSSYYKHYVFPFKIFNI